VDSIITLYHYGVSYDNTEIYNIYKDFIYNHNSPLSYQVIKRFQKTQHMHLLGMDTLGAIIK
jgi:hypothetical protein